MANYINLMRQKENECAAYMAKAEQEKLDNNGNYTVKACVYLQNASKLRGEMARLSVGDEQAFQQRQQQELDRRIRLIATQLNQEQEQKQKQTAKKDKAAAPVNTDSPVSDETVARWFVEDTSHGFESVAGMSSTIERLRTCVASTKHARLRSFLKMSNTHGFLLFGPPGCGKTFITTAFAHELLQQDYKFMKLSGSDILSKYVGDAEKIVNRLFKEALKNAPCIVFIDEIDSVCKNRSLPNLPEYASSITTSFLEGYNSLTDRAEGDEGKNVIFIGATNYPKKVDRAMVNRVQLVRLPLPDAECRAAVLKMKFESCSLAPAADFTYEDMAALTDRTDLRDLDHLVENLKQEILSRVDNQSDEETIAQIQDHRICITRELFGTALDKCVITEKADKEQEEWEMSLRQTEDPKEPDAEPFQAQGE